MFTFLQILIIILFTHILDAISSNTQLVTKYAGMMVVYQIRTVEIFRHVWLVKPAAY